MDHFFGSPLYWLFGIFPMLGLIRVINSGLDRDLPLTRTARIIRVVGGGIWAAIAMAGTLLQISAHGK